MKFTQKIGFQGTGTAKSQMNTLGLSRRLNVTLMRDAIIWYLWKTGQSTSILKYTQLKVEVVKQLKSTVLISHKSICNEFKFNIIHLGNNGNLSKQWQKRLLDR